MVLLEEICQKAEWKVREQEVKKKNKQTVSDCHIFTVQLTLEVKNPTAYFTEASGQTYEGPISMISHFPDGVKGLEKIFFSL